MRQPRASSRADRALRSLFGLAPESLQARTDALQPQGLRDSSEDRLAHQAPPSRAGRHPFASDSIRLHRTAAPLWALWAGHHTDRLKRCYAGLPSHATGIRPMRGLIFIVAVAVLNIFPRWAIAASDQVLRAMYCMSVIDLELAESRKMGPELGSYGVEYYRNLARQRPLTEKEKYELADAQELARTGVSDLDRKLARNRERLRVYWLSNSDALADDLALMTARDRAGIDFEQCKAERPAFSCTKPCFDLCIPGNAPCLSACYVKCGAPTCARTSACLNPTWLPY